ncbi:MAG: exodeoxyribonuclease VII small subunit [Gammaproteobacteria bacterium]|nr:exodeoxyribonuclease VII small subunit [Gammaproteobacteria bacterium]MCP5409179.1 exodeoxyribonuclease VII small subunit [Chromatiaceae bacterium]MCP5443770.1 exodeoxyribonuclease VII small subunit [Chromatiaceae bacterium]
MADNDNPTPSFEQALSELEALVESLEHGEMTLEESLKSFERGVELTRACQQSLKAAEQKVRILAQKNNEAELESFDGNE